MLLSFFPAFRAIGSPEKRQSWSIPAERPRRVQGSAAALCGQEEEEGSFVTFELVTPPPRQGLGQPVVGTLQTPLPACARRAAARGWPRLKAKPRSAALLPAASPAAWGFGRGTRSDKKVMWGPGSRRASRGALRRVYSAVAIKLNFKFSTRAGGQGRAALWGRAAASPSESAGALAPGTWLRLLFPGQNFGSP